MGNRYKRKIRRRRIRKKNNNKMENMNKINNKNKRKKMTIWINNNKQIMNKMGFQ